MSNQTWRLSSHTVHYERSTAKSQRQTTSNHVKKHYGKDVYSTLAFLPICYGVNPVITRMWANAQRDGRPADHRWCPLFNAAVWLMPTTWLPCSNAAKTRYPLKYDGVPQTRQSISAVSGLKFTILSGHVEEVLLLNKFFSDCRYMP